MVMLNEKVRADCGIGIHFNAVDTEKVKGKFLLNDFLTIVINVGDGLSLFFPNLDQFSKFANQLYACKKKLEYQTKEKSNK